MRSSGRKEVPPLNSTTWSRMRRRVSNDSSSEGPAPTMTAVSVRRIRRLPSSSQNGAAVKFAVEFDIILISSSKKPRLTKANCMASCSRARASPKDQSG